MKLVGRELLTVFTKEHADTRSALTAWVAEVEDAAWTEPKDIKARYPSASFLADNEVIFNIKGNNYRLKVQVLYAPQLVIVKRIGTHAEYDRW
jgi:mRNA interferase HigB